MSLGKPDRFTYLNVENRQHAESLKGCKEGMIVLNRELDAKMVYQRGKWITYTDGTFINGVPMAKVLAGRLFCLTGKMWTSREKVESLIQDAGGRVVRSATMKGVTLVQGADAVHITKSKKQADAEARGIPIITDHALRGMLVGNVNVGTPKKKPNRKTRKPAEAIDREQHNIAVNRVFEDIEAIVFGK